MGQKVLTEILSQSSRKRQPSTGECLGFDIGVEVDQVSKRATPVVWSPACPIFSYDGGRSLQVVTHATPSKVVSGLEWGVEFTRPPKQDQSW